MTDPQQSVRSFTDPAPESSVVDAQALPGSAGEHTLQVLRGTGTRARQFYDRQVVLRLTEQMRDFLGHTVMLLVSTADSRGECDASVRFGPPGFLVVLDASHVAYPEYRGNGVMASLGNITENPHVGLLALDLVTELIGLHVNGNAQIVDDGDLRIAPTRTCPKTRQRSAGWWSRWSRHTCSAARTSPGWCRSTCSARRTPSTIRHQGAATSSAPGTRSGPGTSRCRPWTLPPPNTGRGRPQRRLPDAVAAPTRRSTQIKDYSLTHFATVKDATALGAAGQAPEESDKMTENC